MENGMIHSDLPDTFKDAVTVTGFAGHKVAVDRFTVHYPRCKLTTRNAYATISALDAKHSFSGFLHHREKKTVGISIGKGDVVRSKLPSTGVMHE
jgi:hypothetical protein